MTIKSIRNEIKENRGKILNFKVNGARNQVEEFSAEVVNIYPAIFLVRIVDENKQIKSFSYSDILTESLEIIKKS